MTRIFRSRTEKKADEDKLVESTNALPTMEFFERHCPSEILDDIVTEYFTPGKRQMKYECLAAADVARSFLEGNNAFDKKNYLDECSRLVTETSALDYQQSETGWSINKKRKEMKLPDLRYVLLFEHVFASDNSVASRLIGFASFMITYEDSREVIYIYEIHFVTEWQGKGLGQKLMTVVEDIGDSVGVEKAMLTVFKSNARAVAWYGKLGYVEDQFSPKARELRNGTVKEPTYVILSKKLRQDSIASAVSENPSSNLTHKDSKTS